MHPLDLPFPLTTTQDAKQNVTWTHAHLRVLGRTRLKAVRAPSEASKLVPLGIQLSNFLLTIRLPPPGGGGT